jgi:hypothetical protein
MSRRYIQHISLEVKRICISESCFHFLFRSIDKSLETKEWQDAEAGINRKIGVFDVGSGYYQGISKPTYYYSRAYGYRNVDAARRSGATCNRNIQIPALLTIVGVIHTIFYKNLIFPF